MQQRTNYPTIDALIAAGRKWRGQASLVAIAAVAYVDLVIRATKEFAKCDPPADTNEQFVRRECNAVDRLGTDLKRLVIVPRSKIYRLIELAGLVDRHAPQPPDTPPPEPPAPAVTTLRGKIHDRVIDALIEAEVLWVDQIPRDEAALTAIKGIGKSSAAALLAYLEETE